MMRTSTRPDDYPAASEVPRDSGHPPKEGNHDNQTNASPNRRNGRHRWGDYLSWNCAGRNHPPSSRGGQCAGSSYCGDRIRRHPNDLRHQHQLHISLEMVRLRKYFRRLLRGSMDLQSVWISDPGSKLVHQWVGGYWANSGTVTGVGIWDRANCELIAPINRGEERYRSPGGSWTAFKSYWSG
jgi:hypothetical protein